MKKAFSKGDFDYIKFDTDEEITNYVKTLSLLLFADSKKDLYCYDYYSSRAVKYNRNLKKWEILGIKPIEYFDDFDSITGDLAESIFMSIPPFECFKEFEKIEGQKTLERYDRIRKETKRKVIGWLKEEDLEGYKSAEDEDDLYTAALINDIEEHKYFFVADWMPLIPVFDDKTYMALSTRSMGFVVAVSRKEVGDFDYVKYAFGQEYYEESDDFFNPPKEGLYKQ